MISSNVSYKCSYKGTPYFLKSRSKKRRHVYVELILMLFLLSACGSSTATNQQVVQKPHRSVQVCTTQYAFTRQALHTLAGWLVSSVQASNVQAGQGALDLWANDLSTSGDVSSATFFSLSLPAISPKPQTTNPFDPKLAAWNSLVKQTQTSVQTQASQLETATPSSVSAHVELSAAIGCMTVSKIRFMDEKTSALYLILALPLVPLPPLPPDLLTGVTIVGIDMWSPSVAQADYSGFCSRLRAAGAASCRMFDLSTSTLDVLNEFL